MEKAMLIKLKKYIVVVGFSLISKLAAAAIVTTGSAYLNAEPGSWIGGGIGASEVTWTHGVEGIFSVGSNFDQGANVLFDDGNYWSFDFAAPSYNASTNTNDGNRLDIGFYDNATRFPFNSPTRPGMNFSGNGRGNNTLGAWFDVLEIEYDLVGEVISLAVDFRQFDESEDMLGASTYGSLRINSSIALNYTGGPLSQVPAPAAFLLFGSGLISLIGLAKRKA